MRVILLAIAASLVAAGGVFAAEATGTIASISKKNDTMTLSNGKRFHLPEGVEVETRGKGEKVRVSYTLGKGQKRQVSAVHIVR